ncbi:DUF6292 family protein [Streptomyces albogriseolus]|uniref:DUF6292 family protein n=1 Tax=Streptomyces albogriseolus TaxID=1887 RepID=UPI0019A475BF|nr:hypothetical protein [Streptomyces sp.]
MAASAHTATDLAFHARHYVTAVAEQLMAENVPVRAVHACGPYTEPDHSFVDVEGGIIFTDRIDEQLGGHDCGLHWSGTSGWCFYDNRGPYADHLTGARWLGDGLLPEPRRVAAFFSVVRLDPAQAGSTERPYYRQEGRDFPDLLERLAPYVPPAAAPTHLPGPRFTQAQATAYQRRVLGSLAAQGTDPVIDLPMRASELEALGHLLEYIEAVSSPFGPGTVAAHFAQDLRGRRDGGHASVYRHHAAVDYAVELHERLERSRRQASDGENPL